MREAKGVLHLVSENPNCRPSAGTSILDLAIDLGVKMGSKAIENITQTGEVNN